MSGVNDTVDVGYRVWESPLYRSGVHIDDPTNSLGALQGFNPSRYQQPQLGMTTQAGQMLQEKNLANQNALLEQMLQNQKFGMNFNTMNNVMGGLTAAMNLWGGYQSNKLARDQWKTQKSVLNTNMMNQISSYNAALEDRLNYRKQMGGISQDAADRMYDERKAKKY